MPTKNFYDILGISKSASEAEIKKAYKKMAMQYHPDRNKGDKKAEAKFKEVNEAYQTLSDTTKKKNYDQFGSAEWNPFGGMGWDGGNPFGGWQYRQSSEWWFGWFEDIFSQFGGWGRQSGGIEFDIGDLFGSMWWWRQKKQKNSYEEPKQEEIKPNLDVTETVEIPFLDFLFDTSISVNTVYNKHLTLKIKAGSKPGTKYKISGKWRTMDGKTGDMYVIVEAKMPRLPLDPSVAKMIEAIRYQM